MNPVTPAQLNLARWLLERDAVGRTQPADAGQAAERVWEKLSQRLERIFTIAGCDSLASRAIYLAQREFPFLAAARREPGLRGLPGALGEKAPAETDARAAAAAVLGNVVALLVTFIGEQLAIRVIREVWPDAPFTNEAAGEEAQG
jgi:hypothetical protein